MSGVGYAWSIMLDMAVAKDLEKGCDGTERQPLRETHWQHCRVQIEGELRRIADLWIFMVVRVYI